MIQCIKAKPKYLTAWEDIFDLINLFFLSYVGWESYRALDLLGDCLLVWLILKKLTLIQSLILGNIFLFY